VQDFLSLKASDFSDASSNNTVLGAWYVNQILINRRKVLVFMNEKTLLSFIVVGIKKSKTIKDDFATTFLYHFFNFMKLMEFPLGKMGEVMDDYQDSQFCKTDSRQALGNMNDLVFLYEHLIYDHGGLESCDVSDIILKMNEIPQKNLGHKTSRQIAYELLSDPHLVM
jgi:IS30 family transposase